jgi:hypothetical protein
MTEDFVLVPGTWHGGWAYQAVAASLRLRSHRGLRRHASAAAATTKAAIRSAHRMDFRGRR